MINETADRETVSRAERDRGRGRCRCAGFGAIACSVALATVIGTRGVENMRRQGVSRKTASPAATREEQVRARRALTLKRSTGKS